MLESSMALDMLGQSARAFARCYVQLTEALRAEGVPEDVARREARAAAAGVACHAPAPQPCPVCGAKPHV